MTIAPGYVQYKPHAGGLLSPRIWGKFEDERSHPSGSVRIVELFEDFENFGGTVTSNVGTYASRSGSWKSYEDTGDSIAQVANQKGGVIRIATDTTDNDEVWLQSGYSAGTLGAISDTTADAHVTAFEARVAFGQITDTFNAFVGLAEEGLAAADTVTDAGALADKDFIGFEILEADGDSINFVWQKEGQTKVTLISGVQVPVASTFYKLGFLYDPNAPAAKRIRVFVNNVEQSTYGTATQIAAATFPDAEELSILMGIKNGAAAAKTMDVDWVAYGQMI